MPPGRDGVRAGAQDRRLRRARAGAGRSASLRQRASGREASVPRSEQGGSTSTRSNRPVLRLRRRRAVRTVTHGRRPSGVRCGAARRRGPGGARRRRPRPCPPSAPRGGSSCRRARRTGRARARPGAGRACRATVIAARDCGMKRPASQSGESKASNGAVEHAGPRAGPARDASGPAAGRERRPRRRAACWRAARPRRARCRRPCSARAASGPSASNHSAAIHSGWEWRSAASAGVASRQRRDAPPRPRARRGAGRR